VIVKNVAVLFSWQSFVQELPWGFRKKVAHGTSACISGELSLINVSNSWLNLHAREQEP